jgi:threonine/homoserine/homoserine lactone efflux protein
MSDPGLDAYQPAGASRASQYPRRGVVPIKDRLAVAGVAVVLVAVPGPSAAFTIRWALTCERRTALLNVAGDALGLVVQVLAAVVSLGTVIERSAEVFTGLKPAGGAYVVWLGIQAILHRCPLAETAVAKLGALRPLRALTPP